MTDTPMKAAELLPCPFCGTPDPTYDNCDNGSGKWYSCRGCLATVRVRYGEDLDALWNRRAPSQAAGPSEQSEPFLIPVELPDGRIAMMRKCDLRGTDLVVFIDSANLLPSADAAAQGREPTCTPSEP